MTTKYIIVKAEIDYMDQAEFLRFLPCDTQWNETDDIEDVYKKVKTINKNSRLLRDKIEHYTSFYQFIVIEKLEVTDIDNLYDQVCQELKKEEEKKRIASEKRKKTQEENKKKKAERLRKELQKLETQIVGN